jgi:Flp pilus assembly protein TadD
MASSKKERPTREGLRDLDIEIQFLEGLTRRDPAYADALRILGDAYTRRGRIQDGLRVDLQLVTLLPGDPVAHYNLACSYALTRKYRAAIVELERAIECGFRDFRKLSRDPDLARLRKNPMFRQIQDRIRTLGEKV